MMDFNFDEYGCLLTNEGSSSDSAHHTAYYYMLDCIVRDNDISYDKLHWFFTKEEVYEMLRHPDREPGDFSRDQFTAFLGCSAFSSSVAGYCYYTKVEDNWGFFFNKKESNGTPKPWWNRDWLDPATRGMAIRAYDRTRRWKLYFTDLHLLSSVIWRCYYVRNKPSKTADENLLLHLMVARTKHPTPISEIAARYYFRNRPDNDGGKGWRGAINDFWIRGGTYVPGMAPLAIAAVLKVFPELVQMDEGNS